MLSSLCHSTSDCPEVDTGKFSPHPLSSAVNDVNKGMNSVLKKIYVMIVSLALFVFGIICHGGCNFPPKRPLSISASSHSLSSCLHTIENFNTRIIICDETYQYHVQDFILYILIRGGAVELLSIITIKDKLSVS